VSINFATELLCLQDCSYEMLCLRKMNRMTSYQQHSATSFLRSVSFLHLVVVYSAAVVVFFLLLAYVFLCLYILYEWRQ